ncbi:MAG: haloacid dehalogenase-like hydrolase, partial [Ezakiella sp.]
SMLASESRIIMAESIVTKTPSDGITGAEVARAFGADLILLNLIDVFEPKIEGLPKSDNPVELITELTGRPVGLNLEPIDFNHEMMDKRIEISKGRVASEESLKVADKLGFKFVCLTGNPATGVTNDEIVEAIKRAKKNFSGAIIAGKMHSSGVNEKIANVETTKSFIEAGADVILLPAPFTAPGISESELRENIEIIKENGKLSLASIGTSQESSDTSVIRKIALHAKSIGFDIMHIGDSGYGGIAFPENIYKMSSAIRGERHTVSMIARSIRR